MQNLFNKILATKEKYNSSIEFDSRLIKENDIFFGIKTNSRDGGLYALDAIQNGAILAITNNKQIVHKNIIFIKDVEYFIKRFTDFLIKSYKGKVIAISGSVGKTTTKENIFHILNNNLYKAYRSFKNYNNILGLQFSIMNLNLKSQFAVFELGINAPLEMNSLIKILQPHYALLTCVEDSHIGNFKNFSDLVSNKTIIFKSKRLIKGLINIRDNYFKIPKKLANKVSVINLDNLDIKTHKQKLFIISFKFNNSTQSIFSDKGGIFLETAVLSFLFLRLFIKKFNNKKYKNKIIRVYDHSYNASPYSLKKQIRNFDSLRVANKLCIIGSVKELGDLSNKYHLALLEDIKSLNIKRIILIGEEFFKLRSSHKNLSFYKSYKDYIKVMKKDLEFGKNIFVMGSRLNYLDKVIQNIC